MFAKYARKTAHRRNPATPIRPIELLEDRRLFAADLLFGAFRRPGDHGI